jgi:uncharacterized protein
MKTTLCLCLFVLLLASVISAQPSSNKSSQDKTAADRKSQALPPAPPLLSQKVCGQGVYLLSAGGQSLGREVFEIVCRPEGGYQAKGKTTISMGESALNEETTLEVDKEGAPLKFTLEGEASGKPLSESFVFKDGKATITAGGNTSERPLAPRTAVFANGVFYLMQFIAARYDTKVAGEQEIPLFPALSARMERTGRDEVSAVAAVASAKPGAFDRYAFKLAGAEFILWADEDGRIALMVMPAQAFVAVREEYASFVEPLRQAYIAKTKNAVPDYSAPAGAPFTAEEVKIPAKGFELAGTLLLPKAGPRPFAAVVMSTGSGQQQRDSALPGLDKYRPFRQIAEALAARGIAVLRADDRGVGQSGGFKTLNNVTTFDFADDVRAQVAYLRSRSEIDPKRISIIGHSEGGVIAPMVAASDKQLAAIVLMAGTGKRGDEVLRFQLNYPAEKNPNLSEEEKAKVRAETEGFIRAIKENGDVSKYPPALRGLNSAWGRAFLTYDPLTTIATVRQPVLILQGALDQQVTAEQARLLGEAARKGGNKDVTVRVFPDLNHLFLTAKTGAPSEYAALETYALGDELLKALGDWLEQKLKVRR